MASRSLITDLENLSEDEEFLSRLHPYLQEEFVDFSRSYKNMSDDKKLFSITSKINTFFLRTRLSATIKQLPLVERFQNAVKGKNDTIINELITKEAVLAKDLCGNTFLHIVAKYGKAETAVKLLQSGADVHAENKMAQTPIFRAIENSQEMVHVLLADSKENNWDVIRQALLYGTEEIFGLLLKKSLLEIEGDELSKADGFPNTEILIKTFLQHKLHLQHLEESYPLLIFFAAKIRRKDVLQMILEDCGKNFASVKQRKIENNVEYEPRGPKEINVQGRFGETAIHYGVNRQLPEVVQFLLEEGADPNCQDVNNYTPLHFATCYHQLEICQLLLTFGADVNPNLHYPENPLNFACGAFIKSYMLTFQTEYYDNEIEDLHESCVVTNRKIIKLLYDNGAKLESSLILETCQHRRLEEVKFLVELGANIRALDDNRNSALHYVANHFVAADRRYLDDNPLFRSCYEIVDFLLENGLDVDVKNYSDNDTPLMCAVKAQRSEMVKYFVDRGANINAMNKYGEIALHIAISHGMIEFGIELLLELGADWRTLNVDKARINEYYDLYMSINQQVLVAFVALRENQLSDHIKFYIGESDSEFEQALEFFQKSKLEITRMKSTIISKHLEISYFDFLTDFYKAVQIVKNCKLKTLLHPVPMSDNLDSSEMECSDSNSDSHSDSDSNYDYDYGDEFEFSSYTALLKNRFQMAQDSKDFVETTFNFILNYTKLSPKIVEKIMSYLCVKDFRIFGRVLSNKRV